MPLKNANKFATSLSVNIDIDVATTNVMNINIVALSRVIQWTPLFVTASSNIDPILSDTKLPCVYIIAIATNRISYCNYY